MVNHFHSKLVETYNNIRKTASKLSKIISVQH